MNILYLIISLICGALGGNAAGAVMKDKSLGTLDNSLAGILGGGIGGSILQALHLLPQAGSGLDLGAIVANIASGGVGGALLLFIVSLIKKLMMKTA